MLVICNMQNYIPGHKCPGCNHSVAARPFVYRLLPGYGDITYIVTHRAGDGVNGATLTFDKSRQKNLAATKVRFRVETVYGLA
jgi:hypothetical protein